MKKTTGYLRLMRPANVVTSVADVLAGISISGFFTGWLVDPYNIWSLLMLCISSASLYAGGVVFNDVFDADLDKIERPERPIPSGLVSQAEGSLLGLLLLFLGVFTAFQVNPFSGFLALCISAAALIYDKWGKHHLILGPLNMGLCRGLNLLMGISIISYSFDRLWLIAIVPVIYIASVTMISRGEVHGSSRSPLHLASVLYSVVIACILYFARINNTVIFAVLFLALFAWMIYKPLFEAINEPVGSNIGKAVKAGVIALIPMNAAWAAAAGALYTALFIMLLLPLSLNLAKKFNVT